MTLPGCFLLLFLLPFIRKTKNAWLKNLTDLLHQNLMKPLCMPNFSLDFSYEVSSKFSFCAFFFFVQMRKEADDIGPTAELEHWKERMAKFNVYVTCNLREIC